MSETTGETQDRILERWHRDELARLGFTKAQRRHLMALIDAGELELADVRNLVEKRGWSATQAFLAVS